MGRGDNLDHDSEEWGGLSVELENSNNTTTMYPMPGAIPKEFVAYVARRATAYLDERQKEAFPVTFNYERWLDGA